jgi:hypothetical protein
VDVSTEDGDDNQEDNADPAPAGAKGGTPLAAPVTAAGLLQGGPGMLPSGEGLLSKLRGAAQGAKRQAVSQMRGCVLKQGGLCTFRSIVV